MTARIGLGDALRVLRQIDPARRERALELLGLHVERRAPRRDPQQQRETRERPPAEPPPGRIVPAPAVEQTETRDAGNDAFVVRSPTRLHHGPSLLDRFTPLPYDASDRDGVESPIESLFNPAWERAILIAALRADVVTSELDVERVIDCIASAEPVERLPLLVRRSLRGGAQLIVDASDAMTPFADDQAQIVSAVAKIVPLERLDVVVCRNGPPSAHASDDETPFRPHRATTVLILSNFGLVTRRDFVMLRHVAAWTAFANELRLLGCSVVAFVPMDPVRLPIGLRRAVTTIPWDRRTGTAVAARSSGAVRNRA